MPVAHEDEPVLAADRERVDVVGVEAHAHGRHLAMVLRVKVHDLKQDKDLNYSSIVIKYAICIIFETNFSANLN